MFRQLANENPEPLKPKSAFEFFKIEHSQIICTTKRMALAWVCLTKDEKKVFIDRETVDLSRYKREMSEYKNKVL